MEKGTNQENPSLLPNHNPRSVSPKKLAGGGDGSGGDRLKRDEWSEGAVSSLLEAYETKWVLRNRAKLKGHDWEDVARFVSSRANCTKSPKTQTQCKNKIESMKKRYRSESATGGADASSWPLFPRLDLLLRGNGGGGGGAPTNHPISLEPPPQQQVPPPVSLPPPPLVGPPTTAQDLHHSTDRVPKEDEAGKKLSNHASEKVPVETDSSTPALYSDHEKRSPKVKMKAMEKKNKKRQRREEGYCWEVAESIRWLTEVVERSERARMETMRDLEKMRMEAEAKRGEMELKRTEIIANTHLEIARLFASAGGGGKSVDSSLRIGRN